MLKLISYTLSLAALGLVAYSVFLLNIYTMSEKLSLKETAEQTGKNRAVNLTRDQDGNVVLPPQYREDPWQTPYRVLFDASSFMLWSAGPDKIFQKNFPKSDDVLIFSDGNYVPSSPDNVLKLFRTHQIEPFARILVNSEIPKLFTAGKRWADMNGLRLRKGEPWQDTWGIVLK